MNRGREVSARDWDYLIYGTGAIGSVLGAFLSESGKRVLFHGRGDHFAAMTGKGLTVDGLWGTHRLPPVPALPPDPPRARNILLCVKAHQTESAANELVPLLGPDTVVFSMQNGLGNLETLSAILGPERVAGGRVIFGAAVAEPGRVTVTVYADRVLLGFPRATTVSSRAREVAGDLDRSGVPAAAVTDILPALWAKALYNCCLNPLGAILGVSYGQLGEHPGTRRFMAEVSAEIYRVAAACGISLEPPTAADYHRLLMEEFLPPTAAHRSSMLQDLRAGRKTEIDALCGRVAAMGRDAGVPTPFNQALAWQVRFLEETGIRPPEHPESPRK